MPAEISREAERAEGARAPEFAEDATKLNWRWTEHWSGEWGEFELCGLYAKVRDCDGDFTWWAVRKGRNGPTLAEGQRNDSNHFFGSLADAEAALRRIITDRITELRTDTTRRALSAARKDGGQA